MFPLLVENVPKGKKLHVTPLWISSCDFSFEESVNAVCTFLVFGFLQTAHIFKSIAKYLKFIVEKFLLFSHL